MHETTFDLSQHLGIATTVVLGSMVSSLRAYNRYRRDWCGLKLFVRLVPGLAFSALVVLIIYAQAWEHLSWSVIQRTQIPIGLCAIVLTETLYRKLTNSADPAEREGVRIGVEARIAAKRKLIVNALFSMSPADREDVLQDIIGSCDALSDRQQYALLRRARASCDRLFLYELIKKVGVAHAKAFVK